MKDQSFYYRDRYVKYLPFPLRALLKIKLTKNFTQKLLKQSATGRICQYLESLIPEDKVAANIIRQHKPSALLISAGTLHLASIDLEYLKAGVRIGLPTFVPVISWDYLSTKGLMLDKPSRLFVWNEAQVEEAQVHHGVPREKTAIIGATMFDQWFRDMKPSLSREEFCKANGLRAEDPILIYLGSSFNMVKNEVWLISELKRVLKNSDMEKVRRTQFIVRPHPMNYKYFSKFNVKDATILPKEGSLPDTASAFQLYYDTLYHSHAAIGVNTSAMIEAMIVGKPVIAICTEKYRATQTDTQHFRQLLGAGALDVAENIEEFPQVVKRLFSEDSKKEKRDQFVLQYIRPLGIKKSSGEAAADAVESFIG